MKGKRMLVALLLLGMLWLMAACGQKNQTESGNAGGQQVGGSQGDNGNAAAQDWPNEDAAAYLPPGEATPYMEDLGDSVAILFPGDMFADVDLDEEFLEVNEYLDGYANPDGSVTLVMSKARQKTFLAAYRDDIDYNIDYFIQEIDFLRDITYTADFRSMDIYVDGDTDPGEYYWIPEFFSAPFYYYQQLQGREIWMNMTVLDAATHETLLEKAYPEDMDPEEAYTAETD